MCYQISYIIGCLGLKKDWLNSTEKKSFHNVAIFISQELCNYWRCIDRKGQTWKEASPSFPALSERRLLRSSPAAAMQHRVLSQHLFYSYSQHRRNPWKKQNKIPVITVVCCLYQKTNSWTHYVKRPCCINTRRSREPLNIMCFQARCLLSNTLCHLTAVLELEELKLFFPPEECWNALRDQQLNATLLLPDKQSITGNTQTERYMPPHPEASSRKASGNTWSMRQTRARANC